MCISLPAKIISLHGNQAEVEFNGMRRHVLMAAEGAAAGDWVLIYGGVALNVLDEASAEETCRLLRAMRSDVS